MKREKGKEGIAPCGNVVDDTRHEKWRQEFTCYLIGCKDCRLYNGNEYYKHDIKKGLSIWAKAQREMGYPMLKQEE